jgi:protein-tyrosine phosphatase
LIDLHAHILPGFDDGVRSLEDARALAREAEADGVTAIAATPHVRDDYPTSPDQMERGVDVLREDLVSAGVEVEVIRGGEVALERLWELQADDVRRFTYGGAGHYLLVEFPYRGWSPLLGPTLADLRARGIRALLAHPERNDAVQAEPSLLAPAVRDGALVQLTASSMAGLLGAAPLRAGQQLIELGLAHVLATDTHGPGLAQRARLAVGAAALGDAELAHRLTTEVPAAILAGVDV